MRTRGLWATSWAAALGVAAVFGGLLFGASCVTARKTVAEVADASVSPVGVDAPALPSLPHYSVTPYDGSSLIPPVARVPVHAEMVSMRTQVAPMMFAAGEMQTSGEPFASLFAGRNLNDYDRYHLPTDMYALYTSSSSDEVVYVKDLFGFSTAVESYEYSKYYVNMIIQETSAGISLADGPLVAALPYDSPLARLRARMQDLLGAAGTGVGGWATLPAPTNNSFNYLGFAGQWPSYAPFTDFDPTMNPSLHVSTMSCATVGDAYGGFPSGAPYTPAYECDYNTTHLPDPIRQVNRVLSPRVLGMSAWKEALWAIDFVGRIHDAQNNAVNTVAAVDLPKVGEPKNDVVGTSPPDLAEGTYIGSSPLEGMWGLTMVAAMDNASELLISSLLTADGATLGGFASGRQALAYDYTSPLEWFPTAMNVTEDDNVAPYPSVTQIEIVDATSSSEDLSALLLGHSLLFGMTDARNVGLGQKQGLLAAFDGDPFPADDGEPDGEPTPHDRSLSVLRVAFVDLDRLHADPTLGVLHDTATIQGGVVTQSPTATTSSLAHALLGLQQSLLSLDAAITQYGAPDTNPLTDAQGELNSLPIHPPGASVAPSFSERVRSVFTTNAAFVRDVLTRADGSVANGATIAAGVATLDPSPTTLQSQAAAARALTVAFLVTGDATYQARARAVVRKMNRDLYSAPARMYRGALGGADEVTMTPELFGWLQSALRETYKVLYVQGDPLLDRSVLEDRIARVNKLFLNGWDDLNGDQSVGYPSECLGARMQLAEQLLTGELGRGADHKPTADRDEDCVPEIAYAHAGSVMASAVRFHSP